ncbi:hypothetical protein C0J52_13323 [Blattella germanica]|nr:hypothetical protein C0J52_13323 [Blattella germanica]
MELKGSDQPKQMFRLREILSLQQPTIQIMKYKEEEQSPNYLQQMRSEGGVIMLNQETARFDSYNTVTFSDFRCSTCGKSYRYKKNMTRHIRFECGKDPQFKCPFCPHQTKQKSSIQNIVTLDGMPQTMNFSTLKLWPADVQQSYNEREANTGYIELEFRCTQCNKVYRHKNNLMRHKKYECGKEPQFCCAYCPNHGDILWGQQELFREEENPFLTSDSSTLLGISGSDGSLNCEFSNNASFYKNKGNSANVFPCPNCYKVYTWKANLNRHLRLECGKKPHLQCPYCAYITSRKTSLQDHIRRRHRDFSFEIQTQYSADQQFDDNDWNQIFSNPNVETSHQQQQPQQQLHLETVDPEFHICPNCNKSYSNRGNLRRHMSVECGKIPCQKCPYCPFVTKYKGTVQEHIRRQFFNYEAVPPYCRSGQGLQDTEITRNWDENTITDSQKQTDIFSSESHSCYKCGKVYSRKGNLQQFTSYEGQATDYFSGKDTGTKVIWNTNFNSQLLAVTMEESPTPSHPCPNCGKAYSWKSNLTRHLRLECGKAPRQQCPYCPYITNHKSVLQKHIRRIHKTLPNIP